MKKLASFRDPSGFLFDRDNGLYRQINISYKEDFELAIQSCLYDELMTNGLLV